MAEKGCKIFGSEWKGLKTVGQLSENRATKRPNKMHKSKPISVLTAQKNPSSQIPLQNGFEHLGTMIGLDEIAFLDEYLFGAVH